MGTRKAKAIATKGLQDADWGGVASASLQGEAIKAIVKNLSPAEQYQLSLDIRGAVSIISHNLGKAALRFFDKDSGDEIVGGDCFELFQRPSPYWSTSRYIIELISHYLISGEMAAIQMVGASGRCTGSLPINPFRLRFNSPPNPQDRSEIKTWMYQYQNGYQVTIDNKALMLITNFNPFSNIRGLPPVFASVQEVSAVYQSLRYAAQHYNNSAVPSHLVIVPAGTSPKDKKAFGEQYEAMFSTAAGNAHKIMVVEGGEGFDIKKLEDIPKELVSTDLIRLSSERIQAAYLIPPVLGNPSAAKYDSADVQLQAFVDQQLVPLAEVFTQGLNGQIIEPFFQGTSTSRQKTKLKKYSQKAFEAGRKETTSNIVAILDLDSNNIVAQLKEKRVAYAQSLITTFKMTPFEAAEEVGFDIKENDANTQVWHASTDVPMSVTISKPIAAETPAVASEPTEQDQEKAFNYKNLFREFRKQALTALDNNKLFSLSEMDAINTTSDSVIQREIRVDRHKLGQLFKSEADQEKRKELVKSLYNSKTKAYFRDLVRGK